METQNWKVTVSPSVHLAKNSLRWVGYCSAGVIPAFRPFLNHSLTEDITLCQIRVLRYYLDN